MLINLGSSFACLKPCHTSIAMRTICLEGLESIGEAVTIYVVGGLMYGSFASGGTNLVKARGSLFA